jgi:hypothetical protein
MVGSQNSTPVSDGEELESALSAAVRSRNSTLSVKAMSRNSALSLTASSLQNCQWWRGVEILYCQRWRVVKNSAPVIDSEEFKFLTVSAFIPHCQ